MRFELRDVSLSRGGQRVLSDISTEIPPGATSVVGPSGAGKSTLLRLLNRLADPDSGTIAYNRRPLTEYDPLQLRREVSLVPQLPALLEGSVGHNIDYAAGLAGIEPDRERALNLAGLDASFAERDVNKLSVGEQQRVMLARALALEPRVLLLDEPTSALDHETKLAVEATLRRLRQELEISLVFVTHDLLQTRRLGDCVLALRDGRLVGDGGGDGGLVGDGAGSA